MGLDSELGELRQEPPQISRFASAEESDEENKGVINLIRFLGSRRDGR